MAKNIYSKTKSARNRLMNHVNKIQYVGYSQDTKCLQELIEPVPVKGACN